MTDPAALATVAPGVLASIQRARERLADHPPAPRPDPVEVERARRQAAVLAAQRHVDSLVWPRYRRERPLPDGLAGWVGDLAGGRTSDGVYLTGPVGCGKTQAAWDTLRLLASHVPDLAGRVVTWTVPRLLDGLRPSGDEDRTLLDSVADAPLLLLDDLGAERPSEWTLERLYVVLSTRYDYCRPTLITSNLPFSRIADHLGERVASRLTQMCRVIVITGEDRRRTGRP